MRWPESAFTCLACVLVVCMRVREGRTNCLKRSLGSYCPVCAES